MWSEHFANDVFWEEIEFIARLVLAEKGLHLPDRPLGDDVTKTLPPDA